MRSVVIDHLDIDWFRSTYAQTPPLGDPPSSTDDVTEITERILRVLNDPRFRKGEPWHIDHPESLVRRQVRASVRAGRQIEMILPSFAGRPHNPAAHRRVAPDLSELYALLRLDDVSRAVQAVYEPGLRFTIVLDGRAYRPFYGYSDAEGLNYGARLEDLISMLGAADRLHLVDLADIVAEHSDQLRSVDESVRSEVSSWWCSENLGPLVSALRQGTETTAISIALIELSKQDGLGDLDVRELLTEAQRIVAKRAEHTAFEYAVLMTKLKRIDLFGQTFPQAARGTVHPKPDQYSPRMTGPLTSISPWHGVAIIEPDGQIVTRYESHVFADPDAHVAVFVHGDDAPLYYRYEK